MSSHLSFRPLSPALVQWEGAGARGWRARGSCTGCPPMSSCFTRVSSEGAPSSAASAPMRAAGEGKAHGWGDAGQMQMQMQSVGGREGERRWNAAWGV